ncbi:MAG: HD domain-containing protein, partial [Bacillota bacterium]
VEHGTVTVISGGRSVEVTTFRTEGEYSDHRHPDWVRFAERLEDDLSRRDFTFNAMALDRGGRLVDPFDGVADLARRLIRTVGEPRERFNEDGLRMMRAVRFCAQLGFSIDEPVIESARDNARLLRGVSAERIRGELDRLLLSEDAAVGVRLLHETRLLEQFWPELTEGVGVEQNYHHAHTVWEHSLAALQSMAGQRGTGLVLRLAALLHDVAKPRCLSTGEGGSRHFYNHQVVGAAVARRMLKRLKYDNRTVDRVVHLVRHHMALHHYPDMKDSAIRRLINRVGVENMDDLIKLRIADREGSGTKHTPLSRGTMHLLRRIERVLAEDSAFSLGDLAVNGNDVMRVAGIEPGPAVGKILNRLLDEVLEDPAMNTRPALEERIRELFEDG